MPVSDIAVSIRGLSKSYTIAHNQEKHVTLAEAMLSRLKDPFRRPQKETFWALKDVSFDIKKGEVVGIIGRNGAGKSTLLKILSRITEPTTGQIELWGRVGSLLEVGTGFHPELTGRENVFLNGAILGMNKAEIRRQFDAIVEFAGVEKFLDTPVKRYSSGMYVRLAFAVAAHLNSDILIVDEVLAVGDSEFQKKCLGKMSDVAKGGRTVLFVSHNMNAVSQLCSKAFLLKRGTLAASGDLQQTLNAYFSSGNAQYSMSWVRSDERFEDTHVRPHRLAIVDEQGATPDGVLNNEKKYWVEIDVEILEVSNHLEVGYSVSGMDGALLYWTFHTDGPEQGWPEIRKGMMRFKSPWPKRLFNEGSYRVEMLAALHQQRWLLPAGNPASITVEVSGGLSDSPHFNHRREGLFAPVLEWSAEPI